MIKRAAPALLLLFALALAGCAVGPSYKTPAMSPAAAYAPPGDAAITAPDLALGADTPAEWWRAFKSPQLDALVDRALKNNPTLEAAKASLRAAQELVRAQRGAYYPTLEASITPSRQRFANDLASPTASGISLYTLTTSQLSISYTPDLFGANRRAVENLAAQAQAQRFELEAARLTIASNVAAAAIQDGLLRDQIAATETIIADQKTTLESFQRQYQLGQASKADLAAQDALLAQAEATLPPLQKAFQVNRDLIAALVGRTPGEGVGAQFNLASITFPDSLPLSLPAKLVAQRPDVRIAEAQLHAASASVGVAAAARWPNLTITAAAGSAPLGLGVSTSSANTFWSIAGSLTQTLFDAGQLKHKEGAAKAAYQQAAAQYQATVIGAFQNTADTLHALRADADAQDAAERAEQAAAESLRIARQQLTLGDISRLAMLNAEQTEAQARVALLQAKANRDADAVALFQALGGGWWNRAVDAPGHTGGS